jgi:hypothetical protein
MHKKLKHMLTTVAIHSQRVAMFSPENIFNNFEYRHAAS